MPHKSLGYCLTDIEEYARQIWGPVPEKRTLAEAIAILGVVYGDICRIQRDDLPESELMKELGNMITSSIRLATELGFYPEDCIDRAFECQSEFVARRKKV
jgi:hypothetical protein